MLGYPIYSLIFAAVFFGEIPTIYQIMGMCITVVGLSILVRRTTVSNLPVNLV